MFYLTFWSYYNSFSKIRHQFVVCYVVGTELGSLELVVEGRIRKKMDSIFEDPSHPLNKELAKMRSMSSHRHPPALYKAPWSVLCASSHQATNALLWPHPPTHINSRPAPPLILLHYTPQWTGLTSPIPSSIYSFIHSSTQYFHIRDFLLPRGVVALYLYFFNFNLYNFNYIYIYI